MFYETRYTIEEITIIGMKGVRTSELILEKRLDQGESKLVFVCLGAAL
jgi:hypothetical protein